MNFICLDITGASWFHSDELDIDRTATMVPRRDPIKVTKVFQVKFKIEIQFYYYYSPAKANNFRGKNPLIFIKLIGTLVYRSIRMRFWSVMVKL